MKGIHFSADNTLVTGTILRRLFDPGRTANKRIEERESFGAGPGEFDSADIEDTVRLITARHYSAQTADEIPCDEYRWTA
jgi:hypothetical protein